MKSEGDFDQNNRLTVFETARFNHSRTSPECAAKNNRFLGRLKAKKLISATSAPNHAEISPLRHIAGIAAPRGGRPGCARSAGR